MGRICGGIVIALFLLFIWASALGAAQPKPTAELLKQGETSYNMLCAICHGSEGKGDGPAAEFLFPKPRNFTTGLFKVRTTPSDYPPTDQDIFLTITNGMPGSAMPNFSHLSEEERWAIVAFVNGLAKIEEEAERVIQVSPESPITPQTLAKGKELYKKMQCWKCHGFEGRGDGPAAHQQVDEWGFPVLPNDFTLGIYKGGGKLSDVYLRFTTGMDGTPMPSYEDLLSEADRWALVHYVKSLAGPKVAVQPTRKTIVAKKVSAPILKDALDPSWHKVPETTIPLMRLWQRGEAANAVSVRAMHDGREIAFLLEWEDWEVNLSFLRHQDFSDSAAIMFALSQERHHSGQLHKHIINFTMGEKGGPVNIWYWRLDRQMDLSGFRDIETIYQNMISDDYQLEAVRYPKDIEKPGHLPITSAAAHDQVFITGWGSGNLLSIPMRPSAVEDLNAEGFGTLTSQPQADQNVKGAGLYVAGRWKVVFLRGLRSEGPFDVQLKSEGEFPIAFAIWDGSKGDRDGQKAVTTWSVLKLE